MDILGRDETCTVELRDILPRVFARQILSNVSSPVIKEIFPILCPNMDQNGENIY